MKIYLATGNQHKKREMQRIFSDFDIVIPKDEGIDFDPDETGSSFFENSVIKAKALYDIVKAPVIADDSGLCVDALNGAPGIYSSRYAGKEAMKGTGVKIAQEEQNRLLLEQVNEVLEKGEEAKNMPYLNGKRSCHYVCSLTCYVAPDRFFNVQETFEGYLIDKLEDAAGCGGFGYDPLVLLKEYGKTVAEISDEEKDAISHRGKAARALYEVVKKVSL